MVYRVHDEPNSDKLIRFQSFILRFGYYFKADKGKAVAKAMNRLMDKIRGKVEENAIATLAVRTMSKAFYTTDNIGHYGLAFPYYTHFTSPIRRYPDMMVHRLLAGYLAGAKSPDKRSMESLCERSSEREEVAAAAERSSIKYKMTEFMIDKVGMEFDGHISSLTEWGIYVELDETQVEGMVALKDMNDDVYRFDEALYAVVGQSGRKLTLGDKVRIKVLRADLSKKQIDFELLYAIDLKSGRRTDMARPKLIALDDRIYRKDPRDEKKSKRGRNGRR
jgi:ribonuclease R